MRQQIFTFVQAEQHRTLRKIGYHFLAAVPVLDECHHMRLARLVLDPHFGIRFIMCIGWTGIRGQRPCKVQWQRCLKNRLGFRITELNRLAAVEQTAVPHLPQ